MIYRKLSWKTSKKNRSENVLHRVKVTSCCFPWTQILADLNRVFGLSKLARLAGAVSMKHN